MKRSMRLLKKLVDRVPSLKTSLDVYSNRDIYSGHFPPNCKTGKNLKEDLKKGKGRGERRKQ